MSVSSTSGFVSINYSTRSFYDLMHFSLIILDSRCRGTTKWVHHVCIQRWVDEKQKGNTSATVECPQCGTPYSIQLPPANFFVSILDATDKLVQKFCPVSRDFEARSHERDMFIHLFSFLDCGWRLLRGFPLLDLRNLWCRGANADRWPWRRLDADGANRSLVSARGFTPCTCWTCLGKDGAMGRTGEDY